MKRSTCFYPTKYPNLSPSLLKRVWVYFDLVETFQFPYWIGIIKLCKNQNLMSFSNHKKLFDFIIIGYEWLNLYSTPHRCRCDLAHLFIPPSICKFDGGCHHITTTKSPEKCQLKIRAHVRITKSVDFNEYLIRHEGCVEWEDAIWINFN